MKVVKCGRLGHEPGDSRAEDVRPEWLAAAGVESGELMTHPSRRLL